MQSYRPEETTTVIFDFDDQRVDLGLNQQDSVRYRHLRQAFEELARSGKPALYQFLPHFETEIVSSLASQNLGNSLVRFEAAVLAGPLQTTKITS